MTKLDPKKGNENRTLTLVAQAQGYFHELVLSALHLQKLTTLPEAEVYLVNLLNQFMIADHLYERRGPEGVAKEEPLALMLKEALEARQAQLQASLFRRIGDVSLYKAGFFQDSLKRKAVDVDYYIDMGESAYQNVAARMEAQGLRQLYAELAAKFGDFVEVLAVVSDQTSGRSERDLLRMYELWMRTKSERAAKALQEAGILPNNLVTKDWQ